MSPERRSETLAANPLIRSLKKLQAELGLDSRDFVIFGSGPLLAHGLRSDIRDLDVVARGAAWKRVRERGFLGFAEFNSARLALFCDGRIQFSAGWISDDWDTDELIDRADVIDGLRFARLRDVLKYKRALNRGKDNPDIRAISGVLDAHEAGVGSG